MLGVAALCFYMRLLSHCHSTPAGPGQWLTPVFPLVSLIEFSFLLRCVCSNVYGAYVIGTLYIFPAWTASVTRPMCAALTAVTKQKCGGRELGNLGGSELQLHRAPTDVTDVPRHSYCKPRWGFTNKRVPPSGMRNTMCTPSRPQTTEPVNDNRHRAVTANAQACMPCCARSHNAVQCLCTC